MKRIYVIAIVFVASWIVVIANGNFNQDKSESIRRKNLVEIPTKCPPYDNDTIVHLPHETDCTKFYKCSWGERHLFICPWIDEETKTERLHFNKWKQYCDWPLQAGCIDCPGNEEDGYPKTKIPHETSNCGYYYDCINGKKNRNSCPSGKCFSNTCQNCVKNRENGNCD